MMSKRRITRPIALKVLMATTVIWGSVAQAQLRDLFSQDEDKAQESRKVSFRVGTGLLLLPDQPKVNISATETRTPVDLVSPHVRVKTVLERPGGSFDTAFSGTYSYLLRNQYAEGADGIDASGHLIRLELGLRKRIEWIELEAMFGINYIAINDRVDGVDLPIANNLRPSFGAEFSYIVGQHNGHNIRAYVSGHLSWIYPRFYYERGARELFGAKTSEGQYLIAIGASYEITE